MLFRRQFPGFIARKNVGRLPSEPAQQVGLIGATTRQLLSVRKMFQITALTLSGLGIGPRLGAVELPGQSRGDRA
jgi:hypothetical protein